MKRTLLLSAILGLLAPVALVGCGGDEVKTEDKKSVTTPEGTKEVKDVHTEKDTTK